MKKIILFCFLILAFSSFTTILYSQSLELTNADTLVVGDANDFDNLPHSYANIKNRTFNPLEIKVRLTFEQIAEGHLIAFCLGMCYPPTDHDITSPNSFTIEPGQTTGHNDFYATLEHGGFIGTTIVKFKFFNVNNQDDFVEYRCIFNVIYSSVEDKFLTEVFISEPYPNPSDNYIKFNINNLSNLSNPTLKVVGSDGKTYKSIIINSLNENIDLNVSELPAGAYFYYCDFNGKKTKPKQFIIAR